MLNKLKNINTDWRGKVAWTLCLGAITLVFLLAIKDHLNRNIDNLEVTIHHKSGQRPLITEEIIRKRVSSILDREIRDINVGSLDLGKIEEGIEEDSRVEEAEVYLDGRNVIHIEISLHEPIARIMSRNGESYYMGLNGEFIEPSDYATVRVPIFTGNISKYSTDWNLKKRNNIGEVLKVAETVRRDEFLWALVEQIDVDEEGMFTIIPKIGRERIFLGAADDLEFKVENLKLSYKYILRRKGWGKYKELNLAITNQVVVQS